MSPSARGWRLVALPLLVLLLVVGWPIGVAVRSALFVESATVPDDRHLVGLDQLGTVLGSTTWWEAVAAMVLLVAAIVVAQVVLGLVFAASVHRARGLAPVGRALLLLPFGLLTVASVTSWLAAVRGGWVAQWLGIAGTSDGAGLAGVALAEVWRGTGVTALVLLAGLTRVPGSALEMATAEGASPLQRFSRIVLPAALPAIAVAWVFRTLDTWRIVDGPWLLARDGQDSLPAGLLLDTTLGRGEVGLGAAMAVVVVVLTGAAMAVLVQSVQRRSTT